MQVCSNRLQHFLKLYRVPYSVIPHAPTFSSQVTAAAMHVPGADLAKTVVLQGKTQCYLGVLPASYQVDLSRFGQIVGEAVELASEQRIQELFPDCELGAIPPFGKLYGLPTYIDRTLTGHRDFVFQAGGHSNALRMNYQDFEGLSQPEICSFAVKGGERARKTTAGNRRVH